jgi:hypothetical protein
MCVQFYVPLSTLSAKKLFKSMYSYFKQRSKIKPMTKHNYKVIGWKCRRSFAECLAMVHFMHIDRCLVHYSWTHLWTIQKIAHQNVFNDGCVYTTFHYFCLTTCAHSHLTALLVKHWPNAFTIYLNNLDQVDVRAIYALTHTTHTIWWS